MVSSHASTVESYLAKLPAARREVISAVCDVVRKSLPKGFEEHMGYGMISYSVPLARLAETYNEQPLVRCDRRAEEPQCHLSDGRVR